MLYNKQESMNYFHRIELILVKLQTHYQACLCVTQKSFNHNVSRTANRFITIERAMINEISDRFIDSVSVDTEDKIFIQINSYSDMYRSNLLLISFLKKSIKKFHSPSITALLSYWVAGLQVENDEMAKHVRAICH